MTLAFSTTLASSIRLRGANIVPKPTDSGNGDYGSRANSYDTWRLWDWSGWIKPQIDAAAALGANCIRMQGDAVVRVGDATNHGSATWNGTITLAAFNAQLDQLITYLASKGMYFYACAFDGSFTGGITEANLQQYVTDYTTQVSKNSYTNVIGIDVMQEFDAYSINITPAQAITAAKAVFGAGQTTLPVTCSCNGASGASGLNPSSNTAYSTAAAAGADYLDCHIYYTPSAADLDPLLANTLGAGSSALPVFIGETGINYSANPNAGSTATPITALSRMKHYDYLLRLFNRDVASLRGYCAWAITKEWTTDSQDWGLYDNAQDGSKNFTTPRTEETNRFKLISKTSTATPWFTGYDPIIIGDTPVVFYKDLGGRPATAGTDAKSFGGNAT